MGCVGLTIAGGTLEVIGFGLVAWKLVRVQREEFGLPKFVRSTSARLRRLLGRGKAHEIALGDPVETTDRALPLRFRHSAGGDGLAERVSALEQNFKHLEVEQREDQKELEGQLSKLRTELREMRARHDEERKERDERRKERLRASIAWEAVGTVMFVVGAVLSVLGNTISC